MLVATIIGNLPELIGFGCAAGFFFYLGRRFERWRNYRASRS